MRVIKLERSGYMLELDDSILVFDYTRDQEHHVEKALREQTEKAVVFFVTHNHRHTFDTDIFNMAQSHRRVYVLSNDIPTREIHDDMPIAWMSAGDRIEDVAGKGINVEAFDAGMGIAYYVTVGDTTIFFGGSLGEETDKKRTEVLIQRIATEHPAVGVAMVGENIADVFAAKVSVNKLATYQD